MEAHINIRQASSEDSKTITRILGAAFNEYKNNYTLSAYEATVISPQQVAERMKNGVVWIGFINETPVGTISGTIKNDACYIQGMAVIPDGQGNNVGLQLLLTIEEYALNQNCRELILSSTPYLKRAISLYEKFGFEIVNDPPYDLFKTPLFTMKKELDLGSTNPFKG